MMRKNRLTEAEIGAKIERYYEGLTSKEEEKEIAYFLVKHPYIKGFETERAIFSYIKKEKSKKGKALQLISYWKPSVAAAVLIFFVASGIFRIYSQPTAYAYIDGKKITDLKQVKALAQTTLRDLSEKNWDNEAILTKTLEPFKKEDYLKEQMKVFSDLEL